jgi:alpha-ketoglutarate-dependent taurine dioxygenase
MNIKNIHPKFGSIVTFDDPQDFFKVSPDYWRNLIYERKLVVIKKFNASIDDYVNLCHNFGKMWESKDYVYSREKALPVDVKGQTFTVSPMSNKISKLLGMGHMPWHADIPNRKTNPFPHRALWMLKNPNSKSGLTSWLDLEEGLDRLPDNLRSQIPDIRVVQQSWYEEGKDIQEFGFVKTHPISGADSLRINYMNDSKHDISNGWIKSVYYKNELYEEPKQVLQKFFDFLETQPDLIYTHEWDMYDVVIYDNWSSVHKRTELVFDEMLERLFYRANIDHVTNDQWSQHKLEMSKIFDNFLI